MIWYYYRLRKWFLRPCWYIRGSFHPTFEGLPWLRGVNVSFPTPSLDLETPAVLLIVFVYVEELVEDHLSQGYWPFFVPCFPYCPFACCLKFCQKYFAYLGCPLSPTDRQFSCPVRPTMYHCSWMTTGRRLGSPPLGDQRWSYQQLPSQFRSHFGNPRSQLKGRNTDYSTYSTFLTSSSGSVLLVDLFY